MGRLGIPFPRLKLNKRDGENFLWYDKIEYKKAEDFWVVITLYKQQVYD